VFHSSSAAPKLSLILLWRVKGCLCAIAVADILVHVLQNQYSLYGAWGAHIHKVLVQASCDLRCF
jgi:hypothetical protein